MRGRARALCALSGAELWVLGQGWLLLLVVDLGLRVFALQRIQWWSAGPRVPEPGPVPPGAWATIERLHRLVGIASRHHLYRMDCLQRSLVLQRLLGRQGIGSELRIGVRKEGGRVHAHAWLEVGSRPVDEADVGERGFLPLERA